MKITLKELYDFNQQTGFVDDGYIKVKTIDDYQTIEKVDITAKNSTKIKIKTQNFNIITSPEHLLYNCDWIKSKLLKIGDKIETINGYEEILSIEIDDNLEDLYDLQVVNHEFYANGIRSHNSTIKQTIELCTFGKVQGKSGKRLATTELANRRNLNLYAGIYFNNDDKDIIIKKFIRPNNAEISVNGKDFKEDFKKMSEEQRDKLIGFDFDTFKSFISLNMSDFKNFISLPKTDKDKLLIKLFNLESLNTLYSITNELKSEIDKTIKSLDTEIFQNEETIEEYNLLKSKMINNKDVKLNDIKNEILSQQPLFIELKNKLESLDDKYNKISEKLAKLNQLKNDKINEKNKLLNLNDTLSMNIEHYENGICPICNSDLTDNKHKLEYSELKSNIDDNIMKIENCNNYLNKCILENTRLNNLKDDVYRQKRDTTTIFNELKSKISELKGRYNSMKSDMNTYDDIDDKILTLTTKNQNKVSILNKIKLKRESYVKLLNIFAIDSVKKTIINNTMIPINEKLKYYLKELDSIYTAVLDDDFNAKIYELESIEINPETISKGEDKKINLAIALSYLNMILELKMCNVMFLDEIFDGIDVVNMKLTIDLLKKISREHNINIIIVHHGMQQILDVNIFDKIINVEKDIFSNITITNNY
jgi:DNA repair exonuclease SbcCD ATPase subunit